MRAPLVVVIGVLASLANGCASTTAQRISEAAVDLPLPARLPAPDTTADAQSYLTGAIAALRASQPTHATVFIDAILRSDHLTERGRANVYWLAAEAHRLAGNDAGLVEALGGFLVAAAVLDADDDMRMREVEARAAIVARKVKVDPTLGKTPNEAIPVEDVRDPSGIVAELGCGARGDSRYIEAKVASHGDELEERRLICTGTGEQLVLWFDLTHSHAD
jgi:hypothetical protein